ncbi:MAG: hypothetical protein HC802_19005 [Caldilineaceae bacterium]|nr:hypothetical protein [Caldilineaceae bacterium]
MNILTLLARVQLHEFELSLAEWLPRQIADLEWGSTLVVVTPYLDEDGLWLLHNAYRRGSSVTVLICAPQQNFDAIQARGQKLNVQVYRTIWESDLNVLAA